MDHRKPAGSTEPGYRFPADDTAAIASWEGQAVLHRLEECLVRLDQLGWTLPAAQLSQAVEAVRDRVLWSCIEVESGAEGVAL